MVAGKTIVPPPAAFAGSIASLIPSEPTILPSAAVRPSSSALVPVTLSRP